jgi:hypothetical protein
MNSFHLLDSSQPPSSLPTFHRYKNKKKKESEVVDSGLVTSASVEGVHCV